MDLSKLSIKELAALIGEINSEIERKRKADKLSDLSAIKALAESQGYSLEELMNIPTSKGGEKKNPVPVKYRHPAHANLPKCAEDHATETQMQFQISLLLPACWRAFKITQVCAL